MLTRRENSPYWYAVLWMDGRKVWLSTKCQSRRDALAIHEEIRRRYQERRRQQSIARLLGEKPRISKPLPLKDAMRKYCKVNSAFSESGIAVFAKFADSRNPHEDIAEISSDDAIRYLDSLKGSPKTYNNHKSALSQIWRCLAPYSDISENIWLKIPNRPLGKSVVHFRPFSDREIARIINAVPSPWKEACIIAKFTGLRKKDVFELRWQNIAKGSITLIPAKTSRTNRAVYIPIPPELVRLLKSLKNGSEKVFPGVAYESGAFQKKIQDCLKSLDIGDTREGKAGFHSFRASFVTRLESAGIPRHVVQGIVGHSSPAMTELYSHDRESAKKILNIW